MFEDKYGRYQQTPEDASFSPKPEARRLSQEDTEKLIDQLIELRVGNKVTLSDGTAGFVEKFLTESGSSKPRVLLSTVSLGGKGEILPVTLCIDNVVSIELGKESKGNTYFKNEH